jgi:hypothetical protein
VDGQDLLRGIARKGAKRCRVSKGFLCVAGTHILLFLRRFSLRISAVFGVTVISPQSALRYAEERREENLVVALLHCASAPWRENIFLDARLQKYSEYFLCKATDHR